MNHWLIITLLFLRVSAETNPYISFFQYNHDLFEESLLYRHNPEEVRNLVLNDYWGESDMTEPGPSCWTPQYIEEEVGRLVNFASQNYLMRYRVPATPPVITSLEITGNNIMWDRTSDEIVLDSVHFRDTTSRYILFAFLAETVSDYRDFPQKSYFESKIQHDPYLQFIYDNAKLYSDTSWTNSCRTCVIRKEGLPLINDSLFLEQVKFIRSLPTTQQQILFFPCDKSDTSHVREIHFNRNMRQYISNRLRFRSRMKSKEYLVDTPEDIKFLYHPHTKWYLQQLLQFEQCSDGYHSEKIESILVYIDEHKDEFTGKKMKKE